MNDLYPKPQDEPFALLGLGKQWPNRHQTLVYDSSTAVIRSFGCRNSACNHMEFFCPALKFKILKN
jgi:hypothetical protein